MKTYVSRLTREGENAFEWLPIEQQLTEESLRKLERQIAHLSRIHEGMLEDSYKIAEEQPPCESSNYNLMNEREILKSQYNLTEEIISRLLELRITIANERQTLLSYDDLILFLRSAMNYNDMQIWLLRKEFEGDSVSLNDSLTKFFELNDDKSILRLYDIEQNCNRQNIDDVRKSITEDNDNNSVLRLVKKI